MTGAGFAPALAVHVLEDTARRGGERAIYRCARVLTYIRPFMIAGLAAELDKFIKRDWKQPEIDDFWKGPWEAFQVEKKQYAVPVYLNTNMMFINKNHMREAGLTYPDENWDKNRFLDFVSRIYKPRGERWGYDMGFDAVDRNCTWVWNHGGEPHDPKDGPVVTRLTYDGPRAIEGLQFLQDLIWKHQVSPKDNADRGGLNNTDAFLQGKLSILFNAASSTGQDVVNRGSENLDWDFLPLVKGPGGYGARISTDGYMIDKSTKIAEQAWSVLKELVSPEANTLMAQLNRRQPSRRSIAPAFEKVYEGKNARVLRTMTETGKADPRAFWKQANEVEVIVRKYMQTSIVRNEMPVPQAMRTAMEEVRGFLGTK